MKLLGQDPEPRAQRDPLARAVGMGGASARVEPIVTLEEPARWIPSDSEARGADVGIFVERSSSRRTQEEAEDDDESPRLLIQFPDGSTIDDLPPEYCGAFVLSKPPPVHASLVLGDFALQTRAVPPGTDEVAFEISPDVVEKLSARSACASSTATRMPRRFR